MAFTLYPQGLEGATESATETAGTVCAELTAQNVELNQGASVGDGRGQVAVLSGHLDGNGVTSDVYHLLAWAQVLSS